MRDIYKMYMLPFGDQLQQRQCNLCLTEFMWLYCTLHIPKTFLVNNNMYSSLFHSFPHAG